MDAGHKRILCVTPSGYGHVFPLIPVACALQAAGHRVAIATCGISLDVARQAGLHTVDPTGGADLFPIYAKFVTSFRRSSYQAGAPRATVFTALGDLMADGVLRIAEEWGTDLLIHTPEAAAGPIVAAKLSVPAIFLGVGSTHTPAGMQDTYALLARTMDRLRVTHLCSPSAWLDVMPRSLRASDGWPMQFIPYNGGGNSHLRLSTPRSVPRIAVTIGTVIPLLFGMTPLRWVPTVARDMSVEFVVMHFGKSVGALGRLPPNVKTTGWTSLDELLAQCDAVVHHGGAGTMMTSLRAGLPQLVLPERSDEFANGALIQRRGVALLSRALQVTSGQIQSLLDDKALGESARDVRRELLDMPTPASLVSRIVALA